MEFERASVAHWITTTKTYRIAIKKNLLLWFWFESTNSTHCSSAFYVPAPEIYISMYVCKCVCMCVWLLALEVYVSQSFVMLSVLLWHFDCLNWQLICKLLLKCVERWGFLFKFTVFIIFYFYFFLWVCSKVKGLKY